MIKPITEEFFNRVVEKNSKYISTTVPTPESLKTINPEASKKWDNFDGYQFFEKPEIGVFAMVIDTDQSILIVPEQYADSLLLENEEDIDYSDWKLSYLGPPDPIYTLNSLYRMQTYGIADGKFIKTLLSKDGDCLLENSNIGFSQRLTIKITETYYGSSKLLVGFPELLKLPYDKNKVQKLGRRYKNYILWSQKN